MNYSLIAMILLIPNLYFLAWTLYHTYRSKRQFRGSLLASVLILNFVMLVNIIYKV